MTKSLVSFVRVELVYRYPECTNETENLTRHEAWGPGSSPIRAICMNNTNVCLENQVFYIYLGMLIPCLVVITLDKESRNITYFLQVAVFQ